MNAPQPKMLQESMPDILSQEGRPLAINNKGVMEEIGQELPPVPIYTGSLNQEMQRTVEQKGERFMETLNALEWREGPQTMHDALNGTNKDPHLVDEAGRAKSTID